MFSRVSRRHAPLLLVLALLGTAGCSRFSKTRQCRALIAQVNPALDEVTALTDAGAAAGGAPNPSGEHYLAAAARYERLVKDLAPLKFSSEPMAQTVAEYAGILSSTAQNLRALAAALDAHNAVEAERINREIERLTVREHVTVSRIDAWCAADG